MQKDPLIYVKDILFSIDLIAQYIAGASYSSFEDSYDMQDKVMRRLEIIAEAAKKLPDEVRSQYPLVRWKSIIGLRNVIAHTYDEVNLEEIWEIVTHHLPETKKQIEKIRTDLQEKFF